MAYMVKELQTERIAIRFTPTEAEMLVELSTITSLSMTDVVRQAIRREFAERIEPLMGGPPGKTRPTRKPKPKKR